MSELCPCVNLKFDGMYNELKDSSDLDDFNIMRYGCVKCGKKYFVAKRIGETDE